MPQKARAAEVAEEEEQAGRGMVRADQGRDSGSAAEEWAGAAEARAVQVPVAQEQESVAPEEAAVRVQPAEVCGRAALAVAGPVAVRVRVADREQAEAAPGLARAEEVSAEVAQVPVEAGKALAGPEDLGEGVVQAERAELEPAERERRGDG